jgi:hypothetical protein
MRRGGSNVTCGAIALGSHEDTGGLFVFAYCVCGVAAAMSLVVQFVLGVHKEAGGLFVFAKFVCGVAAAMSLLRSPSCSVAGGDTAYIVASCRFVWVAGSRDVVCLTLKISVSFVQFKLPHAMEVGTNNKPHNIPAVGCACTVCMGTASDSLSSQTIK